MTPAVSVVIPTHDRRAALMRTLEALVAQSPPPAGLEVVVVADGCRDDTVPLLRERVWPFPLRVVELDGRGAAAARNAGAAAARGELLLFVDDDVVPGPGWIAAHQAAHRRHPGSVVLGPYPVVVPPRAGLHRLVVRDWWARQFLAMGQPGYRFTWRDLLAGNFSLPRPLFHAVGSFDEAIPGAGGEDWELGIRLLGAGVPFVHEPAARADHYEDSDLARSFRRARQEGRVDVYIGRKHPDCRSLLPLAEIAAPADPLKRRLQWLAFRAPRAGDLLTGLFRPLLGPLERMRLRRAWRRIANAIRYYAYWRGVGGELGTRAAARRFVADGPPPSGPMAELDLDAGLPAAEAVLDRERPAGCVVYFGGGPVGIIPPRPAAEPLRGRHLRALLALELGWSLGAALAQDNASRREGADAR